MATDSVLERFIREKPLCVMTRLIMTEIVTTDLDAVFEASRSRQYQKEALFSTLAMTISEVVLDFCPSPNQAYEQYRKELGVSRTAYYNKLNRVETQTSEAAVAHAAEQASGMIDALRVKTPAPLPGYRCRVVDGNHLQASERRLKELRSTWAAPLPGTTIAVLDLQNRLIDNVYLIEDGHALERTALDRISADVEARDLLIADRHFCTIKFLKQIAATGAFFVIRQHGSLKGNPVGVRKKIGRSSTGVVYEQRLVVGKTKTDPGLAVRRVTVELDEPTRDGDTEIHVLSNVPLEDADARVVSELYRERWAVEDVFNVITMSLTCEVKGLNHPLAALFVFCMAIVAYNARTVLMTALLAVHGEKTTKQLSHYSMSLEISRGTEGLLTAINDEEWEAWIPPTTRGKAGVLKRVARGVDLRRHRKSTRGPKKPPPKKSAFQNGSHVSTARVLAARRQRC